MATTAVDPTVILSIARTPMGSMQGCLADVSATDLGATAVKAAVERAGVPGDAIDRIYMGCVLPAGLGRSDRRGGHGIDDQCAVPAQEASRGRADRPCHRL